MMRLAFGLLVFFFVSLNCNRGGAQVIRGTLLDSDTKDAIYLANIYFSGSQLGTVSNQGGKFILKGFSRGTYDLVFSHVAYEDYIQSIQIKADTNIILKVLLRPKVEKLEETRVEVSNPTWHFDLKNFKKQVLGTTFNSKFTKILNPRVLYFFFDREENTLYAHGRDVLKFKNNALGYFIYYDLKKFEHSMRTGLLYYYGLPRFELMQATSKKDEKKWAKARLKAYKGSFTHFLKALKADRLTEEEFEVRKVFKLKNEARYPEKIIDEKLAYFGEKLKTAQNEKLPKLKALKLPEMDSLMFWKDQKEMKPSIDSIGPLIYHKDSLVNENNQFTYTGTVQLRYLGEKEDSYYTQSVRRYGVRDNHQSSLVHFIQPFPLEDNGYYNNQSVLFEGYLAWTSNLAELLPLEYQPPPPDEK